MDLPKAIHQRDETVIEDVEEVAERGVLARFPFDEKLDVGIRQWAKRARNTHEVHDNFGRTAGLAHANRFDIGCRKRQSHFGFEAGGFRGRVDAFADRRA